MSCVTKLGISIRGSGVQSTMQLSQAEALELYDKTMTAVYEEAAALTR